MSQYDSFRFSLCFFASFSTVFVEPGAAPPVYASITGTKAAIVGVSYNFKAGFFMGMKLLRRKRLG